MPADRPRFNQASGIGSTSNSIVVLLLLLLLLLPLLLLLTPLLYYLLVLVLVVGPCRPPPLQPYSAPTQILDVVDDVAEQLALRPQLAR